MNRLTRLATPALALAAAIGAPLTVQAAPEFYGRVNVSLDRLSDYPDGSLSGQLNDARRWKKAGSWRATAHAWACAAANRWKWAS